MNEIFKAQVFNRCKQLLEQRIETSLLAMRAAQDSANNEDKSSAGDKYETSRAMGQLDRDMNAKQLVGAQAELQALLKVRIEAESDKTIIGSLLETDKGYYFIAVGLGLIDVNGHKVVVLSPTAPLSKIILNKRVKDSFELNKNTVTILAIH